MADLLQNVLPLAGGALGGPLGAGLGSIFGGMFDNSEQQAMDQLAQNQGIYGSIATPNFKQYDPESYALQGSYDPTMAHASTINEDPSLRSAQMSALSKLSGLADTGLSDVDNQGFERARQLASQIQNSGTAAALQNATARGQGGSGLEFAMREMANQQGSQNALNAGLDQAGQSARQRALYQQAYGNALSGLRSQDFGANAANANILNNFNMANTQAQNQGQQYNLNRSQGVADMNVQGRNQAKQYNNNLAQQQYQDQMQKAGGMAGANSAMAGGYAAQNAANQGNRNTYAGMGTDIYNYYNKKPQAQGQAAGIPEKGFGDNQQAWMNYAQPSVG